MNKNDRQFTDKERQMSNMKIYSILLNDHGNANYVNNYIPFHFH